jgi:Carboxypeptidase regulatory-like domain
LETGSATFLAANIESGVPLMRKLHFAFMAFAVISAAVLVTLFGATTALAQEVTAAITGTVTDPSSAPISAATVMAHDTDRGTVWTAKTNDSGVYDFPRVPVGRYDLRIEKAGFETVVITTFILTLDQKARFDVQMKVGAVNQTIEVTNEVPLLQTQSTEVSTIIDEQTNVSLPLASRNYVQLALLAPGAVTPNRESITTANRIDNAGEPYINGNREQDNNFLHDGMDNNQVSDNLVAYSPSPDAIQEFNLITQNASSEFGNFQGGIISVSIKSGTNQFHGDAWEFFRNDKLNANNFFNNFFGAARPPVRWNMFGGTLGGPNHQEQTLLLRRLSGPAFRREQQQHVQRIHAGRA